MILLIVFLILLFIYLFLLPTTEHMINIQPITNPTWAKNKTCEYEMTKIYLDVLNKYNIKETKNKDWSLYFPCTYNNFEKEIADLQLDNPNQRVFIVNNYNSLASKSDMWSNIVSKYGRTKALTMAPSTYILNNKSDRDLFDKEYDANKLYILKKNIQRQEGLTITNNKSEILLADNNYVVVQELLQDPYLINGRKINMRFYVLLVCKDNEINLYVHNNGFMYYTKQEFKKGSSKMWSNITTGYIDRWIYDINPLSHDDFREYLDKQPIIEKDKQNSSIVFTRIYNLISEIVQSLTNKICYEGKLKNCISFQLFGADIALDYNLNPKIMEFNIGPNLGTHDDKDKAIKFQVVEDIFKTIGIIPNTNNGFIRLA